MEIIILPARKEDARFIAQIYSKTWKAYSGKIDAKLLKTIIEDEEKIKKQIESGKQIVLTAQFNNKIIGVIRGNIEFGGIAKISMIAVDTDFRGKGAGKKLLKRFLEILIENHSHKVYIYTSNVLKEAIALYSFFGFKQIALLKNFWFGEDYLFLEKEL